jgi:hypothetical protein
MTHARGLKLTILPTTHSRHAETENNDHCTFHFRHAETDIFCPRHIPDMLKRKAGTSFPFQHVHGGAAVDMAYKLISGL